MSVDTGSGFVDLARQQLVAVPYAFQAQQAESSFTAVSATSAQSADEAPWSGLTGVPSGFADGVDDTGGDYENVIVVAKSGGDYTSVTDAMSSIASPSADNRYLVWVAPGIYTETDLVEVPGYVHLKGAGPGATVITSTRENISQNDDAATARLYDNGRISDLALVNEGNTTSRYAIALWSADATRSAVVSNVLAESSGNSGLAHFAVYLADSEPTIQNSILRARGANQTVAVNAALAIVNNSGGFPQPLIDGSVLIGGGNNDPHGKSCADNTGTGFGLQMTNAAPTIRDSYICGGHRAIFAGVAGITRVEGSIVQASSTFGAFMVETTGSGAVTIATSGVFHTGNSTEPGSSLGCTQSYLATYTDADASCN